MSNLKIKEFIPVFNQVKLTANKFETETKLNMNGKTKLISAEEIKSSIKPYQQILAVGSTVRKDFQVGDWVMINTAHFLKGPKNNSNMPETADALGASKLFQTIQLDTFIEGDHDVLMIYDTDLAYKFVPEDEESL